MRNSLLAAVFLASTACTHISTPTVVTAEVPDFKTLQRGEACAVRVLFFGPFGNATVPKAIWNGQIEQVFSVESEYKEFILFATDCTVVYGQGKRSKRDSEKN